MTIDIDSLNSALELGDANLTRLDSAINDPVGTWTDKNGNVLDNLQKRFADVGYKVPVAYTDGLTVTDGSFTVTEGGLVYAADPAETPFTSGVTFDSGKWLLLPSFTGNVSFTSINSTPIGNTTPSTGVFTTLESEGALTAATATITSNDPSITFEDTSTANEGRILLDNTSINIEVDNLDSVASSVFKVRVDNADQLTVNGSGDVTATGALSAATVAGDMRASVVEAEAGVVHDKVMTPARTAAAIAALAPVPQEWEPYDSVAGDWAADGDAVLYDFASDGAAASAATPASADEYEYTFEIDGISPDAGTENLLLRITYGDDSTGDVALLNNVASTQTASGRQVVDAYNSIFTYGALESRRVKSISFIFNAGASFSAGTIKVWRRRAAFVAS